MPKIYSVTSDDGNTNNDPEPIADKKKNVPPPPPFLQSLTPNVVKLNENNEIVGNNSDNMVNSPTLSPIANEKENSQSFEEQQSETINTIDLVPNNFDNDSNNLENQNLQSIEENEEINNPMVVENQQEPPPPLPLPTQPIQNPNEYQSLDSSDEIPMGSGSVEGNDEYNNTELLFELYTTKIKSLLQKKFIVLNSIDNRVKELENKQLEVSGLDELKEKVKQQEDIIIKLTQELQLEREERIKLENKFEELKEVITLNNENKNEINSPPPQPQLDLPHSKNINITSKMNTQWVKYYDEGMPYYYNVVTNKSMWEVPNEGFMEEWTYNSLYEEYNNNNNTVNTDNNNNNQYYYNQQQQIQQNQQLQTEEMINSMIIYFFYL